MTQDLVEFDIVSFMLVWIYNYDGGKKGNVAISGRFKFQNIPANLFIIDGLWQMVNKTSTYTRAACGEGDVNKFFLSVSLRGLEFVYIIVEKAKSKEGEIHWM